ncbi:MAG TPA: alpha-2-macroglobulin [Gammaproteobacteria bacterium]|nr:alpha-2-macroglobulin [Gammaproteobacteria bacterium]
MNKKSFSGLWTAIGAFFTLIFGRISWSCPPWLNGMRQKAEARPGLILGTLGAILGIILIGIYGHHWYKTRPRPHYITAVITRPQITPVAKTLVPDVLTIDFGINNGNFTPKSVAPLKAIGKEIAEGITLTPTTKGKWVWQSDNRLVFTPSEDWLAGQAYSIQFAKKVFSSQAKMESLNYSFDTLPFQASINEFKFYQDPVDPKIRQAIATIHFNYPVDTKSFEEKTSLTLQALKNSLTTDHFKLTFSYDENKRTAYLHSDVLPLPESTRYLNLAIDKGVKALKGNAITQEKIQQQILIPDAASYFKINNINASIVRNDQDRPEQVLTIETTLGVTDSELNKGLHVYLLPQDYPKTAAEEAKKNYTWQNPGEVTADIFKLSTPLNLKPIPAERDYTTLHSYKISVPAGRFIYIQIEKGIHSFGDYVLASDYSVVVKAPDYPKEIGFLHKGALLALNSEKKLSLLIRGVPAVKFQIARVLPDNINQLITQTEGDFNDPRFINESFNQNNISEIFSETQTFNPDSAKEQYTALDIGKYLSAKTNTGGPQGLFLLQATGWDPEKNVPLDVKKNRLILITDLGLIVKDNGDGSHDVFVESITKGEPVVGTTVSILGKNGLPILTRVTDATGRVNFPTLKDFIDEREPTVYLASFGNDVSFIPYNNPDRQLNFSRFDIGGIYNNPDLQTLSAFVFSDRGIYRPGDTAHFGMIIKQAYAKSQPAGLPLEVTITDPRGTTVQDQKVTLDTTGYLATDFIITPTAPTGQYNINLFIVKDNRPDNLLGSTTIHVAEFQPDRMRITTHLSTEKTKGWISPEELSAKIILQNLYGAPALDRKITGKIILIPERIQFSDYPNYTFVDPLFDPNKPPKTFTDTLSDTQTDKNGEAKFDLNLERFDKATYQLTFYTEGFESEGGRSVAAQTSALVSPLPYFVGYKPDGDLNYIKQNSQRSVNFIAVNPQLKQQGIDDLKIQLAALHPVSTLVKNADGTFQYKSLIQTNVISTQSFSVNEKGTDFVLPTQEMGDFVVSILDKNNTELSKLKYSVVGASQLPLSKNAELNIKLNKSEYLPDEDIEIQVTAPYTGAGLITIERDKIYATQWFKTDTTNSVQKIHIPKDFQGNGYINVAFVRNWDSPEIFLSPLSYSIAPFSVNHDNQNIKINLITPELARPGEAFPIQYKSDKPGKIIIFAVDEGILQVADYKTPDPLNFFFQKHALEVITQQTVDQILPKFIQERELSSVGGDVGENALRSRLNPFKRKTDLPVVYWSGIVDTDNTMRQLIYQVPDYFNGTLHVMAVAVAMDAVGSAEKNSTIRGNFVINPNVPTFVAPGDEFEITASIANNVKDSGKNAKVEIQLAASSQLEIVGDSNQTLEIDENSEKTVRYKIRAKDLLGSAQLDFVARMQDKSSKMSAALSVRPANNYFTTIVSGASDDSSKTLKLDRELYPQFRDIEAAVSSSPMILLAGLQRYLDNFPYGCTEQLVSKAFPLLAVTNQPWLIDPKLASVKITDTLQMLTQRQMSSGGFSYWPDVSENSSNAFASIYAMHFLTEAREKGYNIPLDVIHSGINYLKDIAEQNITSLEQARLQAYAIYILTRNEIVTTNYLTHLQTYLNQDNKHTWKQDITSAYIAATYQLLKSQDEANRLISYYQPQASAKNAVNNFYDANIADAQYLYLLAKHFPERLKKSGNELIMPLVSAINTGEINTILSSYASLALSAYAQAFQTNVNQSLSIDEILANDDKKSQSSQNNIYTKINVDEFVKKIIFNNPSKQMFFYQLTQSGFDKNVLTSVVKNGLEILREYQDLQGKVIDEANLGNEVEVHIHARTLDDRYINNVAIVDLLPGGFEVVTDSVKAEKMDYADVREDRVIFFGTLTPETNEIVYRIKAINTGKFIIPPIFAESMYDPSVSAHSAAGKIEIK